MKPFERNESEEDGTEIGDGGGRETRFLWVHYRGTATRHKGYACEGYDNPPMYWFPDIGEPGWGTSMSLGEAAFENREDALVKAKAYLEREARLIEDKKSALP